MAKLFSGTFSPIKSLWQTVKDAATARAIRQLEDTVNDILKRMSQATI